MKIGLTIISTLIILLVSCRKDEIKELKSGVYCDTTFIDLPSLDTIHPSDYLMTYPSSWWEYDGQHLVECISWAKIPVFRKDQNANGCLVVEQQYQTLPIIKDSLDHVYAINGIGRIKPDSLNYTQSIRQLIGSFGEEWETIYYGYKEGHPNYNYIINTTWHCDSIFDSKILNGTLYYDVVHIRKESITDFVNEPFSHYVNYSYYYAKNIGLVKFACKSEELDWDYERNLTDYYIAPG